MQPKGLPKRSAEFALCFFVSLFGFRMDRQCTQIDQFFLSPLAGLAIEPTRLIRAREGQL